MDFKRFITIAIVAPVILALIDSIRNPNLIEKILHVSSGEILGIVFVALLAVRIKSEKLFDTKVVLITLYSGISLLVLSSILSLLGFLNGPNFIYSKTLLNVDRLFLLGTYLVSVGIIGQTNKTFGKYYKQILLTISLFAFGVLFAVRFLPFHFFEEIVKERGLIENFQVVVLVVGGYYALLCAFKFFRSNKIPLSLLFFFLSFVFILTALDEVSWGQHTFGINAPDVITSNNHQKELTLHNLNSVAGLVPFAYIAIGLYGAFARVIVKNRIFAPSAYLFFYFLLPAIYNISAFSSLPIGVWSEPAELLLYAGLLFHTIAVYFKEKA